MSFRTPSRRIVAFSIVLCLLAAAAAPIFAGGAQEEVEVPEIQIYKVGEAMPDADMVWDHINEILIEEIGATVNVTHVPWGDYPDRIRLLLASGDGYDLHFDADWFNWPELVADDALMPLNDLLPEYAPNLYEHYQEVGALADVTVDGLIYGLPATEIGSGRAWATVNQHWVDEYDIDVDFSTIEGVVEYAEIVTENEDRVDYPFQQIWFANPRYENVMWAMFTKHGLHREFAEGNHGFTYDLEQAYETGEVEIVPVERTEAYLEAARWRQDFAERGWIPRDAMHEEGDEYRVYTGTAAATLRSVRDQYSSIASDYQDFVNLQGYRMYPDSYAAFSGFMRNGFAMNRNADNPEHAMKFMEWMYSSQENYDLVLYGIEGETYELVEEEGYDTVQHVEGRDAADGYPETHGRWGFWRADRQRPGVADGAVGLYTEGIPSEQEHPTNIVTPLAGFSFDPANVRSEIALRDSIRDEYEPPISHGFVDDYEAAVEDLNERLYEPTEAIREEMQRQVDQFLAEL